MGIFSKLKERYIVHKSYNIIVLRIFMYIFTVAQLLWTLLPMALRLSYVERITSLIIIFVIFSFACIIGYLFDVLLFYIIFKKYVDNSVQVAEKQVAPLIFLQLLIPFIFNLIQYFINIPSSRLIVGLLQQLVAILYLGYIVFGNVFKERCVMNLAVYFVADSVCEMLVNLLKSGIMI